MAIMSSRLKEAFDRGISFDASTINGFSGAAKNDLLLFPDQSTMSVLPWRPQQGKVLRFLCDIKNPDGSAYACDTRNLLKETVKKLAAAGYESKIGTECDFYFFKTDASGDPTYITQDEGAYLDMAPADKGENVRRETCLTLEDVGIRPLSSHHETGPGQNNIDFQYNDPLSSADGFLTFKAVAKAIAQRNGLYVSFMPRPLNNAAGSGLHVNLSLYKGGKNLFSEFDKDPSASYFMAGILKRIAEITAFLNPIYNSYMRLGRDRAPIYVSWSKQNRAQLVRIPFARKDTARMELRSPDPAVNPYIAFSLLLSAGLEGIENKEKLSRPVDQYLEGPSDVSLSKLPDTMGSALEFASKSEFALKTLGKPAFDKFLEIKKAEAAEFETAEDKFSLSLKKYFRVI